MIVDLQMPEINGLDVLRTIRELDPDCAVVLMTAHASVDTAIEAVKLGALDYLTKPIDFDRLRDLLDDGAAGHRAPRDAARDGRRRGAAGSSSTA